MHQELTRTTLRTGESLSVVVVEAPDEEHAGTLLSLLSHKGRLRQWQFEEDFAGRAQGLRSRYYLGFLEGRAVANISVWESGPAGNLGHVYTTEAQRRKGICRVVMGAQMADFEARGGQLLVLGTGFDSHPYHIYASFGFQSMTPGSGAMVWRARPDVFDTAFAAGPVSCGDVAWADLGTVCALMALPGGAGLRSHRARALGPCCYESAFIDDMRAVRDGERQVRVARLADGMAVGYAALGPDPTWGGRTALLDLFVHPRFVACVPDLLAGLTWPATPVQACLDVGSPVRAALEAEGFAASARLPGVLDDGGDVELLLRGANP